MISGFPMIYIINMPSRIDRRNRMIALMNSIGLSTAEYTFVEPVKVDAGTRVPAGMELMSREYLSLNLTVMDRILGSVMGSGYVLVLEDDLMPMISPADIKKRIKDIIAQAPRDADMIYLEYCMEFCGFEEPATPLLNKAYRPYCTAAVLYKKSNVKKIQECMKKEGKLIDMAYASCISRGDLTAYVAKTPIFAQDVTLGGDLAHLESPKNIQYYLDKAVVLYDKDATVSKPRLPACADSMEALSYVRWGRIAVFIIIVVATFIILRMIIMSQK